MMKTLSHDTGRKTTCHDLTLTRYLDIAEDYLPEDFKISRCRIAYKHPAKYGDLIVPVMYRPDDERIIISLQDKDMEPYVNIEYTKKDKTEL